MMRQQAAARRAIFTSQRPNNDPEPWAIIIDGGAVIDRYETANQADERVGHGERVVFDPRPEFDHTRDPNPWESTPAWDYPPMRFRNKAAAEVDAYRYGYDYTIEWAPRHAGPWGHDVPVNRVLADVRQYRAERLSMNNPKGWDHVARKFESAFDANPWEASPEELDHARRVLTKIVNVFGNSEKES